MDSGIINQDIGISISGIHFLENRLDLGRVGDVRRDGDRFNVGIDLVEFCSNLIEAFLIPGDEDDGLYTGFGE